MQTGDGLLVRLQPKDAMTIDAFVALCALAHRHGNGVMEITARGNVQLRGLTPQSAPALAAAIADLDIAEPSGVPVITDPLRDDPQALLDAGALAAVLRNAIVAARLALAPKVSIVIDSGGRLHLDTMSADVRLRAFTSPRGTRLSVALGGDAGAATAVGAVAPEHATDVAVRLLRVIAEHGSTARASAILRREGPAPFQSAVGDTLETAPALPTRVPVEAIGRHPLRDGKSAVGVALAFGQADADTLTQLARRAGDCGATALRPAPERALLLLGLDADAAAAIATSAAQLGFITRADDPRRRIAACPGEPACASGRIPARALAAALARELPPLSDDVDIHISGCAKGCAHPTPASLTVVGDARGCGIVPNGSARAVPQRYVSRENLRAEIMSVLGLHEAAHG